MEILPTRDCKAGYDSDGDEGYEIEMAYIHPWSELYHRLTDSVIVPWKITTLVTSTTFGWDHVKSPLALSGALCQSKKFTSGASFRVIYAIKIYVFVHPSNWWQQQKNYKG